MKEKENIRVTITKMPGPMIITTRATAKAKEKAKASTGARAKEKARKENVEKAVVFSPLGLQLCPPLTLTLHSLKPVQPLRLLPSPLFCSWHLQHL